jgi:hypothetical protein
MGLVLVMFLDGMRWSTLRTEKGLIKILLKGTDRIRENQRERVKQ